MDCKTLRVSGVVPESIVDGPGFRYTIFVQGCPHHCPGCHNPQTHDFDGGYDANPAQLLAEINADPLVCGVTFSGGEPFCQADVLAALAKDIKASGKNLMVYSGWTYEQLLEKAKTESGVDALLREADWLVDGRYEESQRDLELRFRGSRNQRVIDLHTKQPIED